MSVLTDDEISAMAEDYLENYRIAAGCALNFGRDLEKAVIARLAQGVSLEPVAWVGLRGGVKHMTAQRQIAEADADTYDTPLYTATAIAAARVQAVEDFKADLADALCEDCENGVKWLNKQAVEKFKRDFPNVYEVMQGLGKETT